MEQGTIPEVSGDNNVKKMSVPRNPLVKPDAYKGYYHFDWFSIDSP